MLWVKTLESKAAAVKVVYTWTTGSVTMETGQHSPAEQGPSDTLEMSLCCLQDACRL